jgi:hypothetical protein
MTSEPTLYGAVGDTYIAWVHHATRCSVCGPVGARVRSLAGSMDRAGMRTLYGEACQDGEALLWEWDSAVTMAVLESPIRQVSIRMGTWDGDTDRAAALLSMPPRDYVRLALMEDDRARDAEISALVAGYRATESSRPREGPGSPRMGAGGFHVLGDAGEATRRCARCGGRVKGGRELCYQCWIGSRP